MTIQFRVYYDGWEEVLSCQVVLVGLRVYFSSKKVSWGPSYRYHTTSALSADGEIVLKVLVSFFYTQLPNNQGKRLRTNRYESLLQYICHCDTQKLFFVLKKKVIKLTDWLTVLKSIIRHYSNITILQYQLVFWNEEDEW